MTNPNECLEWTGAINNLGYGQTWFKGKSMGAHRYIWMIKIGAIPRGKWVLHKCDNKRCVNTNHLYLGTHSDNTRDAVERKRMATGSRHGTKTHPEAIVRGPRKPNALYTFSQVVKMRALYQPRKWTLYALAKRFGGTTSSISRAVRGNSYAELSKEVKA